MKKIIALIMILTMSFAFAACGTSNVSSTPTTTKATTRATSATKSNTYNGMTNSEVLDEAALALELCLERELKTEAGCASVKHIELGSIKLIKNEKWGYEVVAKGTFFAYDEYGDLDDIYKFDATITGPWSVRVSISEK